MLHMYIIYRRLVALQFSLMNVDAYIYLHVYVCMHVVKTVMYVHTFSIIIIILVTLIICMYMHSLNN